MSRIGLKTINIPQQVTLKVENKKLTVAGPKGVLELSLHPSLTIQVTDNQLTIKPKGKSESVRVMFGTTRTLIANAFSGVTMGFSKTLELVGVGYRASQTGKELVLHVGYSHPVKLVVPQGIDFKVSKNTITVWGINKQQVGEIAAKIRQVRPPEPYKGKGIRYQGEKIRRKPGKAVKTVQVS